jgi:DNA-directed RNA polymerase subunit alpha
MVLPRRVEPRIEDDTYGQFIISPLERGYGTTLGTSLRRVLLSSIQGAAVVGIRVNNGLSIHDDIPGLRENMTQLSLQLKQLNPRLADGETGVLLLSLEHKGGGSVYARDISCPPNVRILNPDLYLFTANDDAQVVIEILVSRGKGYRRAPELTMVPDGYVQLDANFSPVRRVDFDVDAARVRQKTNYDKLVLEIWTDGTILPRDALSRSSVTLIKQLQVFDPENDILSNPDKYIPRDEPMEPEANPLYDVPIEVLDLSTRVFNSLRRTGITSVGDVVDMLERGEDAMLAIRNFGQTSLDELKEKLIENGYMQDDE